VRLRIFVLTAVVALGSLFIGLVAGIYVGRTRGIPFVQSGEQWTIGIYTGSSPLDFPASENQSGPVLTPEDVTDVRASFVADPFLIDDGNLWYLFFEVYNVQTEQGDLAVATAPLDDPRDMTYRGVVIDEPFHLSYPYVFRWEDDYYLIPESFETESIRLYRSTHFPDEWELVATLVSGRDYVDPSILRFDDHWWLFSADTGNDTLYLFESDNLTSGWKEHVASPIVVADPHKARSSGRVVTHEGHPYRFTMDVQPSFGTHAVRAFEITELTTHSYAEKEARAEPIIQPDGEGWNGQAMHQLDAHRIGPGRWIASVDGFGKYYVYGWRY
jgi:hypothetical protein